MADGQPVASNNGVERDGETQRLTVHCSDKDCKKRQCKAIKSTFKEPASMNDALLNRIIALMRVSNPSSRPEILLFFTLSSCAQSLLTYFLIWHF
jgi:hypothetical protein